MSKTNQYISKQNSEAADNYHKKVAENNNTSKGLTYSSIYNAQWNRQENQKAYNNYKQEDLSKEDFEANID